MSDTTRAIMQEVPKSMRNGLAEIAVKNGDIIDMAEAIALIAWESTNKKLHAANGVASGIVAVATEVDGFINTLELAANESQKALSASREELDTAITQLETARKKLYSALAVWNPIEKEKGINTEETNKAHEEIVMPAYNEVELAEVELLKITPTSPVDFLRKFAILIDDGGSTCGIDQDGCLLKEAQQLLSVA